MSDLRSYVWPGCFPTLNSNENFRNGVLPKRECMCVWWGEGYKEERRGLLSRGRGLPYS